MPLATIPPLDKPSWAIQDFEWLIQLQVSLWEVRHWCKFEQFEIKSVISIKIRSWQCEYWCNQMNSWPVLTNVSNRVPILSMQELCQREIWYVRSAKIFLGAPSARRNMLNRWFTRQNQYKNIKNDSIFAFCAPSAPENFENTTPFPL